MLSIKIPVKRFYYLIICILLNVVNAFAQPQVDFEEMKKKYAGQDAVVLTNAEHYYINFNKYDDSLEVTSDHKLEMLMLTDRAAQQSEKSIYYSAAFSKIKNIDAKTWVPSANGKKYKYINVDNIKERNPTSSGIFYDDLVEKYFLFPALQPGAVSSLTYTEESYDAHFPASFYFGFHVPALSSEFKITFPEQVNIKYYLLDNDKIVSVNKETVAGKTTYTFRAKNTDALPREDDSPELAYFAPHIIVYVDSYRNGDKTVPVLSDVKQLYKWYRTLYERMDNSTSDELKAFTDSLVVGKKTDDEKIREIFYWIQENIKYVAFEDGLGGLIPRNPKDIYRKRYGDCKDKAVLLNLLLRNAGFESYPAWIGTRDIPYTYEELPTPAVDNHMITALRRENRWYFLDGTSYFLPYKMPTSMIQGKEALIGISRDSFVVTKVEEINAELNHFKNDYSLSIENNKLTGKALSSIKGYPQQRTTVRLQSLSSQKRIEYLQKGLDLGTNKYQASDLMIYNLDNRDSALKYSFNFVLGDYLTVADDDIYINMNLNRPLEDAKIDIAKRKTDRVFDYKYIQSTSSTLKIPQGFKLATLPKDFKFENEDFGCTFKYAKNNNDVVMASDVWVKTLLIKKETFLAWNDFIAKLSKSYGEVVVLTKL